ncbi:MAG TPA: PAS domain S-box protein [Thermoanaerobaculia bacterium]|nr:PAS domain S-box protein [Thermoanaerobaculia bacterium]
MKQLRALTRFVERLRGRAEPPPTEESLARDAWLMANVRDSVIVTDLGGNVTYWNEGATRIFGWTAGEMLGRPLVERYPEEAREQVAELTRRIAAGEEFSGELEDYRKDGSRVWIDARVARVTDDAGRPIGVMGVSHDVTARRQAEAERDLLLVRLRLQIERMPLAYLLFDDELRLIDWSSAAERIFGYRKEEVLGMGWPYDKILPPGQRPRVEENLARLRAGDMAAHAVNKNLTKEGRTIICEWYNTPLFDSEGSFLGFISLAQDVTEQRRLEERYRQAQKMEAIGLLAGGVAHDFNNLLTVINGYSELLYRSLRETEPARAMVEQVRKAGDRAAGLIRQLLSFSRRQVVAPQVLDLNEVLSDVEKMLRRIIGEDVELTTVLGSDLGSVRADLGEVEQVIMNLAVNARDAMPQGGELTVETRNVELDETYARTHPETRPGRHVLLAVRDTGCGMSAEVRAKAFEPFFTTKATGQGTGLGLAAVYGIVRQADGHIEVSSEPGAGSAFEIYLPRVDEPAAVPRPRKVRELLDGP